MLDHMTFGEKVNRLAELVQQSKEIEQEIDLLKQAIYPEITALDEPKIRQGAVSIFVQRHVQWVYSPAVEQLKQQLRSVKQQEQENGIAERKESKVLVAGLYKARGKSDDRSD